MNKEELIETIKRRGEKLRVDDVRISTGNRTMEGSGTLLAGEDKFLIELTLANPDIGDLPTTSNGFVGRSQFWKMEGVIEKELKFSIPHLPPCQEGRFTEKNLTLSISSNFLELDATGFDAMTDKEKFEVANSEPIVEENGDLPRQASVRVSFHAILENFQLLARNAGTQFTETNEFLGKHNRSSFDTFKGEVNGWTYGLIQRDRDLHVYFRSEPDRPSEAEERDWDLFHAFLAALALAHGQHTWPFVVEHWRDGKLVLHRVKLNRSVARTPHAPFSRKLSHNARVRKLKWDFADAIKKAYEFFANDSPLVREVSEVLHLFREAGKDGVPDRITLLALCSLFESLIRVAYDERIAAREAAANERFDSLKAWASRTLENADSKPAGFERILATIKAADRLTLRERFEAVAADLQLSSAGDWGAIFKLWQTSRNPVSHRLGRKSETEDALKQALIAESRIAGAINCIILKLMDYSGVARNSTFEDQYVTI